MKLRQRQTHPKPITWSPQFPVTGSASESTVILLCPALAQLQSRTAMVLKTQVWSCHCSGIVTVFPVFQNKVLMSLFGIWALPLHEPYALKQIELLAWPPLYHNILTLFSVILVLLWNAHLHILLESNSTCLLRPILQVASSGKLFFLTSLLEMISSPS